MAGSLLQSLVSSLVVLKWGIIILFLLFLVRKLVAEKQFRNRKKLPGRTVIITGGNSGIGYATAVDLARRKVKVILACRDKRKGELAANRIRKETRNANVLFRQLDLASFDSVIQFSRTILTTETRINVLINNAGVMACPLMHNNNNLEMQFTVNYLSRFLLTNLLLNLLRKCNGKIINVVSSSYQLGYINYTDLNSEKSYDPWKAFYQSQLANILFTRELSKRVEDVTVNAVYPGDTVSDIRRYSMLRNPFVKYLLAPVCWLMWKSPVQGAMAIIDLIVSNHAQEATGVYYSNLKKQQIKENALDDRTAEKLWEKSVILVGLEKCKLAPKKRLAVQNGKKFILSFEGKV